eukprot:s2173_g2.t1
MLYGPIPPAKLLETLGPGQLVRHDCCVENCRTALLPRPESLVLRLVEERLLPPLDEPIIDFLNISGRALDVIGGRECRIPERLGDYHRCVGKSLRP